MIKNIIFDIGNVLLNFKPLQYMNGKFPNQPWINDVYKAVFQSPEWLELDRGTITEEEAIVVLCSRTPDLTEPIRTVMRDWYDLLIPIEGSIQILGELKAKGYNVYYLSNFQRAAFHTVTSRNNFFDLFDGGIASYKVNLIKPDLAIYEMLSDDYGLEPGNSLFIDDVAGNVAAAEKAGYIPYLFTDPASFRIELEKLKVL